MDAIIGYIKQKYRPLALIVYGSFADGSNNAHSDFDALAILPDGEAGHDGARVDGTELDLFYYPARAFAGEYDPAEYAQVWDGRILWDADGSAARLQAAVRAWIEAQPRPDAAENRKNAAWCAKMLRRAERGDAEGIYRLHWLLTDSLQIFCDLKGWRWFGPKKALRRLAAEDAPALALYERALREASGESVRAWVERLRELAEAGEGAELWDLYNADREIIGEHARGVPLPENGYHLAVHVWIRNSAGEYLVSQRAASRRSYPLKWECPGGSVLKGEDSLAGALRETKEEVGVDLDPARGRVVLSRRRDEIDGRRFNDFMDVWLFSYDGPIELDKATTDEVAQAKWMTREEIEAAFARGDMVETLGYFLTDAAFSEGIG